MGEAPSVTREVISLAQVLSRRYSKKHAGTPELHFLDVFEGLAVVKNLNLSCKLGDRHRFFHPFYEACHGFSVLHFYR
jgi:hypothetical protein